MHDEKIRDTAGSPYSSISALLFFSLFVWMAFNWFETVERILHFYTALPYEDYWRVAYNAPRYRAMDFRVLWTQHNEHRIVFPEIVFGLDMLVWHGRQILPLLVSFLCYFSNWLVLAWTLFSDKSFSTRARNCAILLAGIVIGWKGSAAVLASAFLLQWTLMQLCVFLSLALIDRVRTARTNAYLLVVIASAIVATYSSGNGMLLWAVLIAAGFVLRLRKRDMLALGIASCLSIGCYFIGYDFSNKLNIGNLFLHPLYLLGFLGSYLSMPFGGMKGTGFGVSVGLLSLSTVGVLAVVAGRARLLRSPPGIFLFGSYSFTVLTALLTAAGRLDLADPGFSVAKTNRYLTLPLVNWAVFVSLCVWLASKSRWRAASPVALTLLFALLLFTGFLKLRWWLQSSQNEFADQQLAALAFEDGITDPGLIRKIFPDPGFVLRCLPELRQDNLSVFDKGRLAWLGVPVERFSRPLSTPGTGEAVYTFPVRWGVEVAGWSDESSQGTPYEWIVLANELGQIAGFGRRLPAGLPYELRLPHIPSALGWAGFVNLQVKSKTLSAYVVDPHRKALLPIGGSLPVPPVQAESLDSLGAAIPGIVWQKDPKWTLNGFPPVLRYDTPPPGPIYGSWSSAGVSAGKMLSSVFPAPANQCLILPVLHGPFTDGLSVQILDEETGRSLDSAPIQQGDIQWEFWRVPLDPAIKHLRIAARDMGHQGWGEWLAVGLPGECR